MISGFLAKCPNKGAVKRRLSSIYSSAATEESHFTSAHETKSHKSCVDETAAHKRKHSKDVKRVSRKSSSVREDGTSSTDHSDKEELHLSYRALLKLQRTPKGSHPISEACHLLYPESPLSVGSTCAGSRTSRKDSLIDDEFHLGLSSHESDDHFHIDNDTMSSFETSRLAEMVNKECRRQLEEHIQNHGGELVCSHTFDSESMVLIKCSMGHTFQRKIGDVLRGEWCLKCDEELAKLQEYAQSKGGVTLNNTLSENVEFECQEGHRWMASFRYYRKRKWCVTCLRTEREEQKHSCMQASMESKAQAANLQERLFREAQHAFSSRSGSFDLTHDSSDDHSSQGEEEVDLEHALFRPHEAAIHTKAVSYVKNRAKGDNTTTYKQAYMILKIQSMSDHSLADKIHRIPDNQLSKNYKSVVRRIHPDKTGHPEAGQAFKKMTRLYQRAKK